jgi:hypothetical protein
VRRGGGVERPPGGRINYSRSELTEQEMELLGLHRQILDNPGNPESVFQKLLDNCPAALTDLLDACLMAEEDAVRGGTIVLDFSPFFSPAPPVNELAIVNCIFSKGLGQWRLETRCDTTRAAESSRASHI